MTRGRRSKVNRKTRKATSSPKLSSQTYRILNTSWKRICKHIADPSPRSTSSLTAADISHIKGTSMYPHIPDIIRHEFESSHQSGVKCETTLKRGRKVIIYLATTQKNIEIYLQNIIVAGMLVGGISSNKTFYKKLLSEEFSARLNNKIFPINILWVKRMFYIHARMIIIYIFGENVLLKLRSIFIK